MTSSSHRQSSAGYSLLTNEPDFPNSVELRSRNKGQLGLGDHKSGSQKPNSQLQWTEKDVIDGDTLQKLSLKYNVAISELKRANGIISDQDLFARSTVKVPLRRFNLSPSGSDDLINLTPPGVDSKDASSPAERNKAGRTIKSVPYPRSTETAPAGSEPFEFQNISLGPTDDGLNLEKGASGRLVGTGFLTDGDFDSQKISTVHIGDLDYLHDDAHSVAESVTSENGHVAVSRFLTKVDTDLAKAKEIRQQLDSAGPKEDGGDSVDDLADSDMYSLHSRSNLFTSPSWLSGFRHYLMCVVVIALVLVVPLVFVIYFTRVKHEFVSEH